MKDQKGFFDENYKKDGKVRVDDWLKIKEYFYFKGAHYCLQTGLIKKGRSLLIICGGIGNEAEIFHQAGLDVTCTDYSTVAVEEGSKLYPQIRFELQDAENLTFQDNTFDYCFVRAGLHHLEHPFKAIYEMNRVSKLGFGFQEAHDSLIMRLMVSLKLIEEIEPAGNYVYRFSRREIVKTAKVLKLNNYIFETWWGYIPPWLRKEYLSSSFSMLGVKTFMKIINTLAGRFGNNFLFFCKK